MFGLKVHIAGFDRRNSSVLLSTLEREGSHYDPTHLAMQSNQFRSPAEVGKRSKSFRWSRGQLVVEDEIQSLDSRRLISLGKSVLH